VTDMYVTRKLINTKNLINYVLHSTESKKVIHMAD